MIQMAYLEEWSILERDYADSLSGIVDALTASILCLPVTDGAKVVNSITIIQNCLHMFPSVLYIKAQVLLCYFVFAG